jgi:hypothetical protein
MMLSILSFGALFLIKNRLFVDFYGTMESLPQKKRILVR